MFSLFPNKKANKVKEDIDQQTPLSKATITDQRLASLKLLISFGEALDRFNNDIELCFNRIQPRLYENAVKTMQLPLVEPKTIFKCDLSAYTIGTIGKCVISYIKDIERDLCFIVDIER